MAPIGERLAHLDLGDASFMDAGDTVEVYAEEIGYDTNEGGRGELDTDDVDRLIGWLTAWRQRR